MQKNSNEETAIVDEALPNALFRITIKDTNEKTLAYLAGKMRMYRIKVFIGDTVTVKRDEYGGKARITRRL